MKGWNCAGMGSQDAPSPVPIKMLEHPLRPRGSHLATPPVAQSLPTAHSWEGYGFIQKPQPFPSHTLGCDPPHSFPTPGRSDRDRRVDSVLQLWPQRGKESSDRSGTVASRALSAKSAEGPREPCFQQAPVLPTPWSREIGHRRHCESYIKCWPSTKIRNKSNNSIGYPTPAISQVYSSAQYRHCLCQRPSESQRCLATCARSHSQSGTSYRTESRLLQNHYLFWIKYPQTRERWQTGYHSSSHTL